jgi:hypothetical protein
VKTARNLNLTHQEVGVTVMAMGSRPLLGTELLQGFNLSVDFEEDGQLALTPL